MTAKTIGTTGLAHSSLPARLASLTELTRLGAARAGDDGFSKELLADAEALLRRSGERMRMSAYHTMVALAGGTGSGKSSLFNALAGAPFSPTGITRPTTRHLHACVWGMEGAAPLLDWLGVQRRHRYARASALDEGEASLAGLLLLDLPDHDSVVTGSAAMVERLVKLTDMLIWVLDPLKYADASVHQGYLVPLAGHATVTVVVLNQADTLTTEQVTDCESDLRRLLDAEGLAETPVLVTSAATGAGLVDLRRMLADVVAARRAASDRIAADIDALVERFAVYAGDSVTGWDSVPGWQLSGPDAARATVPDDAGAAAGTAGLPLPSDQESAEAGPDQGADPAQNAGPDQGTDPAQNAGPDQDADPGQNAGPGQGAGLKEWQPWQPATPARPVAPTSRPPWDDAPPDGRPEELPAAELVSYVPAAPAAALTAAFAKAAGVTAVTETLRSGRERAAAAYIGWPPGRLAARLLGRAPARTPPSGHPGAGQTAQRPDIDNAVTEFADQVCGSLLEPWSHTVRAAARSRAGEAQHALGEAIAQGLPPRGKVIAWWRLVALAQWLLMLLAVGGVVWIALILAAHTRNGSSSASDVSLAPWIGVMVAALLVLGWLAESWCRSMVVLAADREREQAAEAVRARIAAVASDLILVPAARELADYERFRAELTAAGQSTN